MSVEAETAGTADAEDVLGRIQRRLSALEDDAANKQVEELLGIIADLTIECKRLDAKNRQYERRLSNLEALEGVTGDELDLSDLTKLDKRDKDVLRAIVADGTDRVSLSEFRRLYRQYTDVRASETMADRIRYLVSEGPFERIGTKRVWEFTGDFDLSE